MRRTTIIERYEQITKKKVNFQLIHMMQFIEQEGEERAEEINARTEEEYNMMKAEQIQTARQNIGREYDKKQFRTLQENQISYGKTVHKAGMELTRAKLEMLEELEDVVRETMIDEMENPKKRLDILMLLIEQALLKILEKDVIIRCRELDENMIKSGIPELSQYYKEQTGNNIKIEIDSNYMPCICLPGVLIKSRNGRISITNSLDGRLEQIMKSCLPAMHKVFFSNLSAPQTQAEIQANVRASMIATADKNVDTND